MLKKKIEIKSKTKKMDNRKEGLRIKSEIIISKICTSYQRVKQTCYKHEVNTHKKSQEKHTHTHTSTQSLFKRKQNKQRNKKNLVRAKQPHQQQTKQNSNN